MFHWEYLELSSGNKIRYTYDLVEGGAEITTAYEPMSKKDIAEFCYKIRFDHDVTKIYMNGEKIKKLNLERNPHYYD